MKDLNYSMYYVEYMLFPLGLYVYYPSSTIIITNFSNPYLNQVGSYLTILNFNSTKCFEMSSQIVEINTDSSYILKDNLHCRSTFEYEF